LILKTGRIFVKWIYLDQDRDNIKIDTENRTEICEVDLSGSRWG
jgi:hypothetical protein